MKIMTTNEKRVYVEPQMMVCVIDACSILAGSGDPQPEPESFLSIIIPYIPLLIAVIFNVNTASKNITISSIRFINSGLNVCLMTSS